jgi:hypothetical protein
MTPPFDRQAVLEGSNAQAAMEVVRRRRLVVPKIVGVATEILAKLDELASAADPSAPDLPADASKVEKVLADAADRRVRANAIKSLAGELRHDAVTRQNGAVLDAGGGWVNALADAAAVHLATLRELAPATPRISADQISTLNAAQFDVWSKYTTAVINLEVLIDDRAAFARLLTQVHSSHWGARLPLIAAVLPPVGGSDAISRAFRERIEIKEVMAIRDAPSRWFALLELETRGWIHLSLASVASLGVRVALIDAWPRAFEALSFHGDGGVAFAEIVTDATRCWDSLASPKSASTETTSSSPSVNHDE